MILENTVAVDLGVDAGDGGQGVDDGLREERHKAEFETVFLDEFVLILRADCHDGRHIDLVEGGEHGGFTLSGDEALRDLGPEGRHFPACLA